MSHFFTKFFLFFISFTLPASATKHTKISPETSDQNSSTTSKLPLYPLKNARIYPENSTTELKYPNSWFPPKSSNPSAKPTPASNAVNSEIGSNGKATENTQTQSYLEGFSKQTCVYDFSSEPDSSSKIPSSDDSLYQHALEAYEYMQSYLEKNKLKQNKKEKPPQGTGALVFKGKINQKSSLGTVIGHCFDASDNLLGRYYGIRMQDETDYYYMPAIDNSKNPTPICRLLSTTPIPPPLLTEHEIMVLPTTVDLHLVDQRSSYIKTIEEGKNYTKYHTDALPPLLHVFYNLILKTKKNPSSDSIERPENFYQKKRKPWWHKLRCCCSNSSFKGVCPD